MISDRLPTIAAVLFAVGLLVIVWVLYRTIRGMHQRAPGQPAPRRTATSIKALALIVGILLVAISQLVFWLNTNLAFFAAADDSKLMGKLQFETLPSGDRQVVVSIRRSDSGTMVPVTLQVKSETLVLEAETITFSKSYSMLGLGEFGRIAAIKLIPPPESGSEAPFEKRIYPDADQFWELLNGAIDFVPGVETSKLLSEPIPFETGAERHVSLSQFQLLLSN